MDSFINWRPLYTRARGPLTHDIQIMWLVKKPYTIQVHFKFYTRPWGHEGQFFFEWMTNCTWRSHAHSGQMSHGLLDIALGPSKRCGSNHVPWQTIKLPLPSTNFILPRWGPALLTILNFPWDSYNPSTRSTFTLHWAWGSIYCKNGFLFSRRRSLDDSQQPLGPTHTGPHVLSLNQCFFFSFLFFFIDPPSFHSTGYFKLPSYVTDNIKIYILNDGLIKLGSFTKLKIKSYSFKINVEKFQLI